MYLSPGDRKTCLPASITIVRAGGGGSRGRQRASTASSRSCRTGVWSVATELSLRLTTLLSCGQARPACASTGCHNRCKNEIGWFRDRRAFPPAPPSQCFTHNLKHSKQKQCFSSSCLVCPRASVKIDCSSSQAARWRRGWAPLSVPTIPCPLRPPH